MDIDVFDDNGKPIRGEMGHLVAKKPAPSMTRGFWNEPDRYIQTYWSKWPNIWYHGDWAFVDEDGFWSLHGRSDDTIKIAGRRTGPAEIEAALIEHPAVSEAATIGVPDEIKGEDIVCFVVLNPDYKPDEKSVSYLQDNGIQTDFDYEILKDILIHEGLHWKDRIISNGNLVNGCPTDVLYYDEILGQGKKS